jgi:hypothetical protein
MMMSHYQGRWTTLSGGMMLSKYYPAIIQIRQEVIMMYLESMYINDTTQYKTTPACVPACLAFIIFSLLD